jgi:hypothetical protein
VRMRAAKTAIVMMDRVTWPDSVCTGCGNLDLSMLFRIQSATGAHDIHVPIASCQAVNTV